MTRAVNTVIGVLLLTAVAVVLAGAASLMVLDATVVTDEPTMPVEIEASVTVGEDATRVVILHESGPTIDVGEIDVRIAVDGTPLPSQPEVPYYSEPGFRRFPSGPFNPTTDPRWELGERAVLTATHENHARLGNGTTVRIELYRDDLPIARVETTAH